MNDQVQQKFNLTWCIFHISVERRPFVFRWRSENPARCCEKTKSRQFNLSAHIARFWQGIRIYIIQSDLHKIWTKRMYISVFIEEAEFIETKVGQRYKYYCFDWWVVLVIISIYHSFTAVFSERVGDDKKRMARLREYVFEVGKQKK